MRPDRPLAEPKPPHRRIRQTVRRARFHWYQSGVPRRDRRRMAEELRDHLEQAAAEGRRVEDVVGHDLPAFAASWAHAERRNPRAEIVLSVLGGVLVMPGLAALLNRWLLDDRYGFDVAHLAGASGIALGAITLQFVRRRRFQFSSQQAAWIGVVGLFGFVMLGTTLREVLEDRGLFVAVPAPLAWTLVAIAVGLGLVASWLKRSGSRPR